MKLKAVFFTLAMLALLDVGNSALAGDEKVYAGSFCQPAQPAYADDLRYTTVGIENISSSEVQIVCPIARDNTRNSSGVYEIWVTGLRVEWGHESYIPSDPLVITDWECTFVATNHRGDTIASQTLYFDIEPGRRVVQFTEVDTSHVQSGHYSLLCDLPRYATLVEYEVDE